MREIPKLDRNHAEWISIGVLGAIARDPARLERFLSVTGFMPNSIRNCAKDPKFLAGVVDYVADDPDLLLSVIREMTCQPADIAMAQYALRELPPVEASNVVRLPIPPRRVQ